MPAQCEVCAENPSKYKCPTCTIPYCSLNCYKKHREITCQKPTTERAESNPAPEPKAATAKGNANDDDDYRLTSEQLQNLSRSEAVHNYLKHPQIRKLISTIDSSNDPAKMLDEVRQNDPVFGELLDELLQVVTGKKPGTEEAQ
ncbi:unnamed protein product [Umbelopsis vinacea]